MRTWTAKPLEIDRKWWIVDATDKTLGRLATEIADTLRGKNKPQYTPHIDTGDFVVVLNAKKIRVKGNKAEQKSYFRHTGYFGGIKETSYKEMLENTPERIISNAVEGMLPKNKLASQIITKLKVYPGSEHPHNAQKPELLTTKEP